MNLLLLLAEVTPPEGEGALLRWGLGLALAALVYQHIQRNKRDERWEELRRTDLKGIYGDMKAQLETNAAALGRQETMSTVLLEFVKEAQK